MRERAHELYSRRAREQSFDDWLTAYSERCVVGSLEEVAERLRGYEHAGCDRVMLQHLLHTDLEPVRLLGRDLTPALA
jgi:alkanesulfonate monooxygenase SsuD/methylene tetrahydromethanopterin reductase-like flavin-dependent oxidoreductase (luciferase family)